MEEIIQFLAGILNREFIRAVFSNPRVKDNVVKAKLRPMEQKGELLFQLESFTKTQAFHKNLTVEETKDELAKLLEEFRQVQVETVSEDITVLISKKGKATIKRKRKKVQAKAADLSHNRKKKYILEEGNLLRTFCRSLTRTESLHFWTLDVENHILHLQCIIIYTS